MTRISWGTAGTRLYEAGVDRGVLYLDGIDGVPWDGLTSVKESPSGGGATPYYLDGFKYLNVASAEEFEASIEALTNPSEFARCDGTASIFAGLFATQQPREPFGLTYRTLIGNDLDGQDHGYKIHLVYNALAEPTDRDNSSLGGSVSPLGLSWKISTTPIAMSGRKPTSHLIIDSTKSDPNMLAVLEGFLYGANNLPPRLPTPTQLVALFGNWSITDLEAPLNFIGMGSGDSLFVENLATNPSFESVVPGSTVMRTNLALNARAAVDTTLWAVMGTSLARVPFGAGFGFELTSNGSRNDMNEALSADIPGGVSVTISFDASGTDSTLNVPRAILYHSSSQLTQQIYSSLVTDGEIHRVSIKFVTTGPINRVYVGWGATTNGVKGVISNILVEQTDQVRPYFDGSTPDALGWDYSWSGVANASTSTAKASSVTVRTNYVTNPLTGGSLSDIQGVRGTISSSGTSIRLSITDAAAAAMAQRIEVLPGKLPVAIPGEVWTMSGNGRSSIVGGTMQLNIQFRDAANAIIGSTILGNPTDTNPSTFTSLSTITAIAPAGTAFIYWGLGLAGAGTRAIGDTLDGQNVLLEKSAVALSFFSGSSPSAGDFSYAWTGTADASTSIQTAPGVAGATTLSAASVQSSDWTSSGTKSVRTIPTSAAITSVTYPAGSTGMTLGMVAGKTYTAIVNCRLTAPLAGVLYSQSRSLVMQRMDGGTFKFDVSQPAPNVAGVTGLRLTFSLPTGTTAAFFYLCNGASAGNGDVWWDDLCIVEGVYDGPYLDGNSGTIIYQNQEVLPLWAGISDASTSSFEYYTDLPEFSNTGDSYIIGNDLWVFDNGVWHNFGVVPGLV